MEWCVEALQNMKYDTPMDPKLVIAMRRATATGDDTHVKELTNMENKKVIDKLIIKRVAWCECNKCAMLRECLEGKAESIREGILAMQCVSQRESKNNEQNK